MGHGDSAAEARGGFLLTVEHALDDVGLEGGGDAAVLRERGDHLADDALAVGGSEGDDHGAVGDDVGELEHVRWAGIFPTP